MNAPILLTGARYLFRLMKYVMICFAILSVAKGEEPSVKKLIGHWRYVNESAVCNLLFKQDGTFSGNIVQAGKVVWEYAGEWSFDGDVLKYKYTLSSSNRVPVGTIDQDKLVRLNDKQCLFESKEGIRREYLRVDER